MQKLIIILGPTASGKTDLAIKLAKKFNGEIVCADSRQIYSEMAIGTASPLLQVKSAKCKVQSCSSKLKVKNIPHHLFNVIPPTEQINVARYQKLAVKTIKDIQKRGKIPFLVGGTAFYIYSVVEGWQFPKSQANQELRKTLEQKTAKQLFAMLKKISPLRGRSIDQKNKRRLIRAIEIAKQLGQVPQITKKPIFDCLVLGINPSKQELKKRIEKRTEKMIKQGLEKEAKQLVKKYGWTDVLKNTIGYAEFSGSPSFQEIVVLHTLQFAKRQMTWFKRDKKIRWVKNPQQASDLIKKFTERTPL